METERERMENADRVETKRKLPKGPGLEYFIANSFPSHISNGEHTNISSGSENYATDKFNANSTQTDNGTLIASSTQSNNGPGKFVTNSSQSLDGAGKLSNRVLQNISHPYIQPKDVNGNGRKVYFDVRGCQMNVSDTEVAWAILRDNGYVRTTDQSQADVVLVMTCSIREGAEDKIWHKLDHLRGLKKRRLLSKRDTKPPLKIGVLGCMAERLKSQLVEKEKSVDVVAGPDSYRDLPRLLALVDNGDAAINVLLSQEETYAEIIPVSLSANRMSAFVSIMRGCDNMCTYCIVPFTRGRERSRDMQSILEEVRYLSDEGIKEITLLGQNVNSYRDTSQTHHYPGVALGKGQEMEEQTKETQLVKGFKTVYKPKKGGIRFADLLDKVSMIDPGIRIRFTSPHPKDFPDEVLYLIQERNNICNAIHLPAQCGSSRVLELMRRGYTREAYMDLVTHIRSIIPNVALTSDFICGFCSETEEEFQETLSMLEQVKYSFCYLFPYSLREKTAAHRRLVDDVPHAIKMERLQRMITIFRSEAAKLNRAQVGQQQVVLVEGTSKRAKTDLVGRNDANTRVIFPDVEVESQHGPPRSIHPGDYVVIKVTDCTSQVLKGIPLSFTTLASAKRSVIL
ncbi:hypothetical protein Pmani_009937 [Petrolisthes manimaculis]|uniref:CDK5RAP1-like protein n=1 Tax=Petrolisthes manimaculis TaxID=1843537 RepID=A0AAE1Q2G7_9EUCA|nr:hypothetical protein Pmani_009937 [Petrolisthes manimaculis]